MARRRLNGSAPTDAIEVCCTLKSEIQMPSNPTKILIIAMKIEATPFTTGLGLERLENSPIPVFKNQDIAVVISGIGKSNAAMAATYSCLTFSPAWICNLGAAGAVDPALSLGDILQIAEITEFDRPRLQPEGFFTHKPDRISGIKTASLATQDRPILSPDKRQTLSRQVQLVDMEAAAIVQVCKKFAVPCHVFKFVSDTVQHTEGDDIIANIRQYGQSFFSSFHKQILPKL